MKEPTVSPTRPAQDHQEEESHPMNHNVAHDSMGQTIDPSLQDFEPAVGSLTPSLSAASAPKEKEGEGWTFDADEPLATTEASRASDAADAADATDAADASVETEDAPAVALSNLEIQQIEEQVIEAMRTVFDPEIPVNIYELGLIYELRIDAQGSAVIEMTLTSPACPVAGSLPGEVEQKVLSVDGIQSARVELVWDPPWTPDMMSEAAQLTLGFF